MFSFSFVFWLIIGKADDTAKSQTKEQTDLIPAILFAVRHIMSTSILSWYQLFNITPFSWKNFHGVTSAMDPVFIMTTVMWLRNNLWLADDNWIFMSVSVGLWQVLCIRVQIIWLHNDCFHWLSISVRILEVKISPVT